MFHWKKYILSIFCALWVKDFHTSVRNCFSSVLDYALYVSRTILRMEILSGKNGFLFCLWPWVTKFQTFRSISLACFYWRSFYVSKKLERRQQKREKLRFYTFFGVFERKIFALWPKSLRQCFQNCVLLPREKLWRKMFSKNSSFMLLLGLSAERFRTLSENFLHVSPNCILRLWKHFSSFFVSYCELKGYQNLIDFV